MPTDCVSCTRQTVAGAVSALLLAAVVGFESPAAAQSAAPPPPPATSQTPAVVPDTEPAPPPGPRPLPGDARNLEEDKTDPADIGLFVPRVVLFPFKLATQLVFFPLRHGLRFAQRHALVERVVDILYNDERTAAIVPTFQFISAYGPTIGAKAFHSNLAGHGEKLELSGQAGGVFNQAYELSFNADRTGGSRLFVSSVVRYDARPRLLFEGIGDPAEVTGGPLLDPRAGAARTRFNQDRVLLYEGIGYTIGQPGNLVKVGAAGIFNHRTFGPNSTDERSIEEVYDTTRLVGYQEGATTTELDATLEVDTRDSEFQPSTGVFLDAFAGFVPAFQKYTYAHYGIETTGYINLYHHDRVLVLRGGVEAVEGNDGDIPFSSLPRLGGPTRLRGYRLDRFRDEKSALATIEYQYPIHEWIGGALFADAGRVAKNYRGLTDLAEWRLGFGGGIRVRTKDTALFAFDLAYGNDGLLFFFTTTPLRAFSNRQRQL